MDEVQKPAECLRQWPFRCISRFSHGFFKHSLYAETGERRARGKNALLWIANQDRSERPERHPVRLEHMEARVQCEDEAVAPSSLWHFRSFTRVLRGQF